MKRVLFIRKRQIIISDRFYADYFPELSGITKT